MLPQDFHIFCQECLQACNFTDPDERCRSCFRINEETGKTRHCPFCQKTPSSFYHLLSVFDGDSSPPFILQRRYSSFQNSFLSEGAVGLMAYHYLKHGRVWPDLVVPLPMSPYEKVLQGFSPEVELARHMAKILNVPYASVLAKKALLKKGEYRLKRGAHLEEKHVLLIGDQMKLEFFEAADALAEGLPKSISGLTFTSSLF